LSMVYIIAGKRIYRKPARRHLTPMGDRWPNPRFAHCPIDVYVNVNYHPPMSAAAPPAASSTKSQAPRDNQRLYSIAELAREFAVTPRTIRFYEDEGLIKPQRQGLIRIYSSGDRARLSWILRGKRLGFSLGEIKELLDLYQVDRTGVQQ